jgi:diguanylate cyclase (GGDEF)-like protein
MGRQRRATEGPDRSGGRRAGGTVRAKARPAARPRARASGPDLAARLRVLQSVLRDRIQRPEAVFDVLRAVSATTDPEIIAATIIDLASAWIPASSWGVVTADLSGQLSILAERRIEIDQRRALFAIGNQLVTEGGLVFASANLSSDLRVGVHLPATAVGLALVSRTRRVGAVVALDAVPSSDEPKLGRPFAAAVERLLEPAAIVLDTALALQRAELLSVTDDLTQLYNSRYLGQVLHRETKRASRSARPLSLLFIDLDGFKLVNDAYGHLCGSRALVEAAAVIKGSARETDVVARFGGDEFALVLPETGGEGAFAVGERIRERVAAHAFLAGEGLDLRLTASVGVATLPDVASTSEGLVQAADRAMYAVKERGKNGIQMALHRADN